MRQRNSRLLLIAVLLPAVLCFSAFAQDLEESEDLAIRETLIRLTRAINNKDAQAYSALVTDKFDLIWRSSMPVSKSNVLKAANPRFSLFVEMLRRTSEKTALVDGVYGEGRFSAVLVKREERWLVSALRMAKPTPAQLPLVIAGEPAAPADNSGWISLFDGKTSRNWLNAQNEPFPEASWKIEDGCLKTIPGNVRYSLRTRDSFGSFELRFEWKVAPGANSGVKYHITGLLGWEGGSDALGYEYQIADDDGDPGAKLHPSERSAALYHVRAPLRSVFKPVGEWNSSVVRVDNTHVEHWLNGVKVVEAELDAAFESPIVLQHHHSEAWFRNVKIRRL
jgi:hypothetical protein